jgi:CRISPR/Cas system-associated exonuclease Cas4 (RecB family)
MASAKFTQPWGWSKLDTYRGCPAQFKYRFIDKRPEPSSPALERGSRIHEALERYINGWSNVLPPDINVKFWAKPLQKLKELKPKTEASWGIDKQWGLLPDWFHANTWCRAKSDVYYLEGDDTMILIDFKTGKYRTPSADQVRLYATIGASALPAVQRVRTSFWFVDQAEVPFEEIFDRKNLNSFRGTFAKESEKLYKDRSFKPKPGRQCRYCAHSRQKGGPCEY